MTKRPAGAKTRPGNAFGGLLREWRSRRGVSQAELAAAAGVSTRHVSFVETGRASPSREMVLTLAQALDVPLRDRNALLEAGGFAAVFRETSLDAPEMREVRRALGTLLSGIGFPTFVVNHRFELVLANEAARRLLTFFVGPHVPTSPPPNALELLLSRRWMRSYVTNWDELIPVFVRRERLGGPLRAELREALAGMLADRDVTEAMSRNDPTRPVEIVLPVRLCKGDVKLSLFSMISTIGSPQDITLQELRIESLLPADADSAAALARVTG